MTITKIDLAKKIINIVVGFGTAKIVSNIVSNNSSATSIPDRIAVATGSLVIGSMAADATTAYTDAKIDELVNWWRQDVKS